MPANTIDQITDQMISERITSIDRAELCYIGALSDAEGWREKIDAMPLPTVERVREMLEHEIDCGSPEADIDVAIGMAMELEGLPGNCCVELWRS